jgi:hypothetical protein
MVFIRIKTRLARGSAAQTCTNEKSFGADRCFGADDEPIRAKATIFNKPLAAGRVEPDTLEQVPFALREHVGTSLLISISTLNRLTLAPAGVGP